MDCLEINRGASLYNREGDIYKYANGVEFVWRKLLGGPRVMVQGSVGGASS